MPRGKKYNAAELHFIKKRQELDKKIKYLEEENLRKAHTINNFSIRVRLLENENKELKDFLDEILEMSKNHPDEDLVSLIKQRDYSISLLSILNNKRFNLE